MKPYWSGVFPAITTQLKKDGTLDLEGTVKHAHALIESGVTGLIFLGSLGENQAMIGTEKRTLIGTMVKAVDGQVQQDGKAAALIGSQGGAQFRAARVAP